MNKNSYFYDVRGEKWFSNDIKVTAKQTNKYKSASKIVTLVVVISLPETDEAAQRGMIRWNTGRVATCVKRNARQLKEVSLRTL